MHLALHLPRTLPAIPWAALWQGVYAKAAHGVQPIARTNVSAHALDKGSTYTLLQPEGLRVECLAGCVWITLDCDVRDTVLEAGESYCANRQSRALVHALTSSNIRISPAPQQ